MENSICLPKLRVFQRIKTAGYQIGFTDTPHGIPVKNSYSARRAGPPGSLFLIALV